jgi:hypothetical protein
VTPHGTIASIVTGRGLRDGVAAFGIAAFVVQEDEMIVIAGLSSVEQHEVSSAAVRATIDLFPAKAPTRRFLYPPPRGWRGQPKGTGAIWYSPQFPRSRATLTVSPAEPKPEGGEPRHVMDAIVELDRRSMFVIERAEGPESITSRFGLSGSAWAIVGLPRGASRLWRDIVVLGDEHFVYTFILAALTREERELYLPALQEVVLGARPHIPDELVLA